MFPSEVKESDMTHLKWLQKEVPRWVAEKIVTPRTGDILLSRYEGEVKNSGGAGFFILAAACFLVGILFICAGYWGRLTQDERFVMAISPFILSLVFMAVILWKDRMVENPPVKETFIAPGNTADDAMAYGGASDSLSAREENRETMKKLGEELNSDAPGLFRTRWVSSGTSHHLVPAVIRESAAVFHGLSYLGALFLVQESFKLSDDLFVLSALSSLFLLVMTYISCSCGLGMISMLTALSVYRLAPHQGWPEMTAWFLLILALPFLVQLLGERRHKAVVCYFWMWAVSVLALIFWTASGLLWQTMFFALAASLTWMAGALLGSWGKVSDILKVFGAIAVFAVLLEGSWSVVWKEVSGSWVLWLLFLFILAVDAVLLTRMSVKKEALAILAGCTPFIMLIAVSVAIFETTGAVSALIVSVFAAFLGVSVIGKGYRRGSSFMKWSGLLLLLGTGIMRVIDSALTFGQRGSFFLLAGVISLLLCTISFANKKVRRRKKRRRPEEKPAEENGTVKEVPASPSVQAEEEKEDFHE